ncbi:3-keto-5-aminohexanoate cleavage protein [Pelagibacterium limicola]|uniref:3-keto-5-aminohexanoate cleavage protein n=1 Tax=Pelagibacterium limicola TaxID=2791022 RepID=UPI0018AFCB06|nr:3-keto-5-aminohexanoate cleavage protein [Pelagibacterium limicola]
MSAPALIMVAPNGARRTKADHEAIPLTIAETARVAAECREAGADAIHAHLRDRDGAHILDADGYRELMAAIARQAGPDMVVQITTEAVGRYSPAEQRAVVDAARPEAVSVALREMLPDVSEESQAAAFYARCSERAVAVQHILYAPGELTRLADFVARGIVPGREQSILLVLGRYTTDQQSAPGDLVPFLAAMREAGDAVGPFMTCAFGRGEIAGLGCSLAFGGHARVGFENSIEKPDGAPPRDNAESVATIAAIAESLGRKRPDRATALATLGLR